MRKGEGGGGKKSEKKSKREAPAHVLKSAFVEVSPLSACVFVLIANKGSVKGGLQLSTSFNIYLHTSTTCKL